MCACTHACAHTTHTHTHAHTHTHTHTHTHAHTNKQYGVVEAKPDKRERVAGVSAGTRDGKGVG